MAVRTRLIAEQRAQSRLLLVRPLRLGARWRGFGPRAARGPASGCSACAARVRAAGISRAALRAICRQAGARVRLLGGGILPSALRLCRVISPKRVVEARR